MCLSTYDIEDGDVGAWRRIKSLPPYHEMHTTIPNYSNLYSKLQLDRLLVSDWYTTGVLSRGTFLYLSLICVHVVVVLYQLSHINAE